MTVSDLHSAFRTCFSPGWPEWSNAHRRVLMGVLDGCVWGTSGVDKHPSVGVGDSSDVILAYIWLQWVRKEGRERERIALLSRFWHVVAGAHSEGSDWRVWQRTPPPRAHRWHTPGRSYIHWPVTIINNLIQQLNGNRGDWLHPLVGVDLTSIHETLARCRFDVGIWCRSWCVG